MLDPMLSLVSSMQSDPGTYAILAGSGVSRAAHIPTGYEVMLALIKRVAEIRGATQGPDPVAWFRSEFKSEPTYPTLLDALAPTSPARSQLLRGFFEPSEEERARGVKVPTRAHLAVAQLVQAGFIRVIVTTNFDRLFEQALEQLGITPTVVRTPDDLKGIRPLMHLDHLVVKVHGDYMDTRMKNTAQELATFTPEMNALLARIFDEFGLIVCGWSGENDGALRLALENAPGTTFGTCWTVRGTLTQAAADLILRRKAQVIPIRDADDFFDELAEKVNALAGQSKREDLSVDISVERLKTYLPDERFSIKLKDLINGECANAIGALKGEGIAIVVKPTHETMATQMLVYERAVRSIVSLLAVGSYFGESSQSGLWADAISRIARRERPWSAFPWWDQVGRYPAILACYAAGIGALAADKFPTFWEVMNRSVFEENNGDQWPAFMRVRPWAIDGHLLAGLPNVARPDGSRFSRHIFGALREGVGKALPDGRDYSQWFDRFELYAALMFASAHGPGGRVPLGRFAYEEYPDNPNGLLARVGQEINTQRNKWPLVAHGCFDSDFVKARDAVASLKTLIEEQGPL